MKRATDPTLKPQLDLPHGRSQKFRASVPAGLAALAVATLAAEAVAAQAAPGKSADWRTWLENKLGTLYKDKENPLLQEFRLMGRFHYQAASVDGEAVDGGDFSETYDEYRRARLGLGGKFLQYFGFLYQVNLVSDSRYASGGGKLDWGYQSIDEAYLTFDLGKAMGGSPFDKLVLSYGRHKQAFGEEVHVSSNKLLTVERSGIANKVYGGARPTGLKVDAAMGDWNFIAALQSTTRDGADNKEFNGWQDSEMVYTHVGYRVDKALRLSADFVYNDADATTEDSILAYRSAVALGGEYSVGPWGMIGSLIYGDNGGSEMTSNPNRQGDFWGFVVMPWYWIVDDQLQFVGQYQYAAAEESEGIRIHSRYGRGDGTGNAPLADVNSGRGDQHHQFYLGLNYYISGHNLKIQGGVEYQTMDTPKGDFNTLTWLLALRTFF